MKFLHTLWDTILDLFTGRSMLGKMATPWEAAVAHELEDDPEYTTETDWSLPLREGRTHGMIVDYVLEVALIDPSPDYEAVKQYLMKTMNLTEEQVVHAVGRIFAGVRRAAFDPQNQIPDEKIDPLAWNSFQRAVLDPAIIAAIYPYFRNRAPA